MRVCVYACVCVCVCVTLPRLSLQDQQDILGQAALRMAMRNDLTVEIEGSTFRRNERAVFINVEQGGDNGTATRDHVGVSVVTA